MSELQKNLGRKINQHNAHQKFSQLLNADTKLTTLNVAVPNFPADNVNPNAKMGPSIDAFRVRPKLRSQSQKRLSNRKPQESKSKQNDQYQGQLQGISGVKLKKRSPSFEVINKKADLKPQQPVSSKKAIYATPIKIRMSANTTSATNGHSTLNKQLSYSALLDEMNLTILLNVKQGLIVQDQTYKRFMSYIVQAEKEGHETLMLTRIVRVLNAVKRFLKKHRIENGLLQSLELVKLSRRKVYSNYQLICLFNQRNVLLQRKDIPGLQYYLNGAQGKHLAAARIQSLFRMRSEQSFCRKLSSVLRKVKVIQKYWRVGLMLRKYKRLRLQAVEAKIHKHKCLQEDFNNNWALIKNSPRVQVHIASYSLEEFKRLSIDALRQKQNSQLTRIFRATEVDVQVIFVTPFPLSIQVLRYYERVFSFHHAKMKEKVFVVNPENYSAFQGHDHMTTASVLLYSPKTLTKIRAIIGKKHAYIVPSYPSVEYINLSAELSLPIFSSPQNICKLLSTKNGCRQIFKGVIATVKNPSFELLKSVDSIYSEKEMMHSLAILLYRNRSVPTWYFKIDDEIASRGLAYFNVSSIAFIHELLQQETEQTDKDLIQLLSDELEKKLSIRLKIVYKEVYPNYKQFISHFLTRGGTIEASPVNKAIAYSVSFYIDPKGQFQTLISYHKLELASRTANESIKVPASQIPIQPQKLVRDFYKYLWVKLKMFGYFTVDMLFEEKTGNSFAIGLDCFLNSKTASSFFARFCTKSSFDNERNRLLNCLDENVEYIYCPTLKLVKMPQITTFFKNCKYNGVSFDIQRCKGVLFALVDELESQQIGIISINGSLDGLLGEMKNMLQYFSTQHRSLKNSTDEIGRLRGCLINWHRKFVKVQKQREDINLETLF